MNVIWAPQAKQDFWNNIDYLEAEWSEKVALSFIEKVNTTIALLKMTMFYFLKQIIKTFIKLSSPNKFHFTIVSKTLIWNYYVFGILFKTRINSNYDFLILYF